MHVRYSMIVAVFAAWFLAASASAQTRMSVAVLSINSVEGDDATALYLSDRLRQLGGNIEGWSMRREEVSLAQMELAHDCVTTDLPCLQTIAATLQVGSLIFGSIRRVMTTDGPDFVLDVARYDALEMRIVANHTDHVPLHGSVEALNTLAMRVIEALSGSTPTAAGVAASATDASGGSSSDETPAPPVPGTSINPWPLVLLGGAALTLGVTIASWVRLGDLNGDPMFREYRESFPMGGNACDLASAGMGDPMLAAHARNVCSDASTFEVLQYVFLGTTLALAAGGGIWLGLEGVTSREAPVTVRPSVTAHSASVTLAWRM